VTRLHYTSRSDGSRRAGRAYRGVSSYKLPDPLPVIPAGPGLVQCPRCLGHVKLVKAAFTDTEAGITYAKTDLRAAHRRGGTPSRGAGTHCPGSHEKVS
jgi:hypothetical protein